MKVLITGGSGLLGQYLNIKLAENNNILTLYHNNPGNCRNYNSAKVNITDAEAVEEIFLSYKPDVVIHSAAVSTPQKALQIPAKEVYSINVKAAETLSRLCNSNKSRLIYISTDLVYAGYRGQMLTEESKLIPISLYAETKLMGEQKVISGSANYIILRTALMYGFGLNHSKNHFHEIYFKMKSGEKVKLFTDQYRTPLALHDAARMIDELLLKDIENEIINFGGRERLSRYQLGELLCKAAGYDLNLIEKISMKDVPDIPHVEDVSMSTAKLQSYGIIPQDAEAAIRQVIRQ